MKRYSLAKNIKTEDFLHLDEDSFLGTKQALNQTLQRAHQVSIMLKPALAVDQLWLQHIFLDIKTLERYKIGEARTLRIKAPNLLSQDQHSCGKDQCFKASFAILNIISMKPFKYCKNLVVISKAIRQFCQTFAVQVPDLLLPLSLSCAKIRMMFEFA